MQNYFFIVILILSSTVLTCGCRCKLCYPEKAYDKLPFPLTDRMLAEIRSTAWSSDLPTTVALSSSELDRNMKSIDEELTRLTTYYRQSSSVIKINRSDIFREQKDGQTLLVNKEKIPLNGVYVITLYKNFYAIMDIRNGLPDGVCILYYYMPSYTFYSKGYYKNGKPVNGSFPYIYERDLLLPFSFDYYKGVFVRLNTDCLILSPLWKKYNTISVHGKILDGYSLTCDLKEIKFPGKILFNRYVDGQIVNTVELNDTNLVYPLASIQEVFETTLANVISQRYAPKDWR